MVADVDLSDLQQAWERLKPEQQIQLGAIAVDVNFQGQVGEWPMLEMDDIMVNGGVSESVIRQLVSEGWISYLTRPSSPQAYLLGFPEQRVRDFVFEKMRVIGKANRKYRFRRH